MSNNDQCTGYPVGNFGISGEITPSGRIFSRVMYNPPLLGEWLIEIGRGEFAFSCDGMRLTDSEFETKRVDRLFPEATATYADARLSGVTINSTFLAPIKAGDAFVSSIPALCAEFELVNDSSQQKEVKATFEFHTEVDEADISLVDSGGFWLVGGGLVKVGFDAAIRWSAIEGGISVSASRTVPPKGAATVRFVILCHDTRGFYAKECPDPAALAAYVSANWTLFKSDRAEFVGMLPRTHDEKIDSYTRWYMAACILLTRVTQEHVLTMGYRELNQRDSFWTSWVHLVLWPDLERRMIEESASFQSTAGKIPTTVLPVIEREDDIDINEYFNMRIVRYYEWTHDLDFVRKLWPSFKSSIEYLKSRDTDNDGYLDQGSFWGDWKDVSGVEGRKAAPHFEFLWLAVLKSGIDLATKLGDTKAAKHYEELYERSYKVINADVENGGLWTGRFYTTLWHDGRSDNHVQEDQLTGPLYGVLPSDRIPAIYASLEANMTPWGVRDTYPYRENFSHKPGDYHNGGIWPFLNFADALARFTTGYPSGGYDILRRVGEWDLEKEGDYLPCEYLDGDTGSNAGWRIQGWDADYYGAVVFGVMGVKMLSETKIEIMPRVPDTASFDSPIPTPYGLLPVKQTPGAASLEIEVRSQLDRKVSVRYGAMTSKKSECCTAERVGECEFTVTEFDIEPGGVHRIALG